MIAYLPFGVKSLKLLFQTFSTKFCFKFLCPYQLMWPYYHDSG